MKRKPKFLTQEVSTRKRSDKQEKSLAKSLGGRVTINSGATFSENDIIGESFEVEAKTTLKGSFIIKESEFEKMVLKCDNKKMPLMIIEFEKTKRKIAVLHLDDLTHIGL